MSMTDKDIKERIEITMNSLTPFELLKLRSTIIQICILCAILKKKLEESR